MKETDDHGERDKDGLSAAVLRQRYKNEIPLDVRYPVSALL